MQTFYLSIPRKSIVNIILKTLLVKTDSYYYPSFNGYNYIDIYTSMDPELCFLIIRFTQSLSFIQNNYTKNRYLCNFIYFFVCFIKRSLFPYLKVRKMKKMLLMGSSGAGKTSMHSVIFANYPAKDTQKIGYTVQRQQHKFKFMGALTLNLWDCGGQDTFMEQYFLVQRQTIFRGVQVLIYVFDIEENDSKLKKSLQYWSQTVKSIQQYNQNANIFVLIHKIDKVPQSERNRRFYERKQQIEQYMNKSQKVKVKQYFKTSIWDETLYQAWSKIVQLLIPNRQFLQQILKKFCEASLCNEAVLFERSTFLILSYHDEGGKQDLLKYEKVANIIKQFKLTCNKLPSNVDIIQVNTSTFTGLIQEFTSTQNILAIFNNREVKTQAVSMNIVNLGKYFAKKKKSNFAKDS